VASEGRPNHIHNSISHWNHNQDASKTAGCQSTSEHPKIN